jgi:hypothetical protein
MTVTGRWTQRTQQVGVSVPAPDWDYPWANLGRERPLIIQLSAKIILVIDGLLRGLASN